MRTIRVWGFSQDDKGRAVRRVTRNNDLGKHGVGTYRLQASPIMCRARFDRATIEFDEASHHRPYMLFSNGHITGATIPTLGVDGLDADMVDVWFSEASQQPVQLRWDLDNSEIIELVGKGLFGFEYSYDKAGYRKPAKDGLEVPGFFTHDEMNVLVPCDVDMSLIQNDGRVLPLVAVFPRGATELRLDTRRAEGAPLSSYFDEPQFLEDGYEDAAEASAPSNEIEFLSLIAGNATGNAERDAGGESAVRRAFEAVEIGPVEDEPELTPDEAFRLRLAQRVDARVLGDKAPLVAGMKQAQAAEDAPEDPQDEEESGARTTEVDGVRVMDFGGT